MTYVEQDPLVGQEMTVGEALYAGDAPVMQALREFEVSTELMQKVGVEKGYDRCVCWFRKKRGRVASKGTFPPQIKGCFDGSGCSRSLF